MEEPERWCGEERKGKKKRASVEEKGKSGRDWVVSREGECDPGEGREGGGFPPPGEIRGRRTSVEKITSRLGQQVKVPPKGDSAWAVISLWCSSPPRDPSKRGVSTR